MSEIANVPESELALHRQAPRQVPACLQAGRIFPEVRAVHGEGDRPLRNDEHHGTKIALVRRWNPLSLVCCQHPRLLGTAQDRRIIRVVKNLLESNPLMVLGWIKRKGVRTKTSDVVELAKRSAAGDRVLFVDDDPRMVDVIESIPDELAVDLTMVTTAGEAKQIVDQPSDKPLLAAILDYKITNGDGVQLFFWLKQNHPSVHVIFLTGYPPALVNDRLAELGLSALVFSKESMFMPGFFKNLLLLASARTRQPFPA